MWQWKGLKKSSHCILIQAIMNKQLQTKANRWWNDQNDRLEIGGFVFSFLWAKWFGNHLQEDFAKFG